MRTKLFGCSAALLFACACGSGEESASYAKKAGTADHVGTLSEDDLRRWLGTHCPPGTVLQGWDGSGTAICLDTPSGATGPAGEPGAMGGDGVTGPAGATGPA